MKRVIFRSFFTAALCGLLLSSLTGCYYDDDEHWHDGYHHYYGDRDYGYRDRDDDSWRGRFHHDHDDD